MKEEDKGLLVGLIAALLFLVLFLNATLEIYLFFLMITGIICYFVIFDIEYKKKYRYYVIGKILLILAIFSYLILSNIIHKTSGTSFMVSLYFP